MPRLPEITEPNDQNRAAFEYLKKTRGSVRGGFAVMLASPEVTQRIAHVGSYARFESQLPPRFRELAVLATSVELENPVETAFHARACRELGVREDLLRAVAERAPLPQADEEDLLAIRFARELARNHKLDDATFAAARQRLGDKGLVDLVTTIGYYAMMAVCHVALGIEPP